MSWLILTLGLAAGAPRALASQAIAEVQVIPETVTLAVGQKQMIFAAAYDRRGNLIPDAKVTFWSSDTSVVHASHDGGVVGIRPGLAKVEARVQRRRASIAVLVTGSPGAADTRPPQGTVLTLDPPAPVVLPGEAIQLVPRAVREDGTPFDIGAVSWKSLKPAIATVDSTGRVTGVAPGSSIIQAITARGLMATAPVGVVATDFAVSPGRLTLPVGTADTIRAYVPAQENRRLYNGVSWQSGDTNVVMVDTTGVIHARGAGTTNVIASGFGQERQVTITVHKIPEALIVSPPHGTRIEVPRRGKQQFSVVIEAADSTPIVEIQPVWSLKDTTAVSFDSATKTITAKAIGATTLTATVPGFQPVVWTIDVIPGLVRLDRRRVGLTPGERATVEATLSDAAGESVGLVSDLHWASDRPGIAAVSAEGTITGVSPGRATITATAPWGHRDTLSVFVTGDLLVTSDRDGAPGLYTMLREKPDTFFPVLQDASPSIDGVYSPDRTRLAFSSNRAGSFDIYIADADGLNPRRITNGAGDEVSPAWVSGDRLAYIARLPDSTSQAYIVAVAGGAPRRLTTSSQFDLSPAAAPDGSRLALISTHGKRTDVYLVDPATGAEQRVTDNGDRELLLQFFSNGDLLYAQERGGGRSARLMRRTLSEEHSDKLFDTRRPLISMSVSRDGRWIAYAVGSVNNGGRAQPRFALYFRDAAGDHPPIAVPLRPNERITHIAF